MTRGYGVICLITTLFVALAVAQDVNEPRPTITTKQISQANIIGDLGVPLGTCVAVQATIVKDRSNTKERDGRLFLEITHVEGRKLPSPVVSEFHKHQFATKRVKIANDHFELYKLRTGNTTGSLTREQIEQLEQGYVGATVSLTVYETGGFRGIPNRLPKEIGVWQDVSFRFSTTVNVIDEK